MFRTGCALIAMCGACVLVGAQAPDVPKSWNDIVRAIVSQVPGFVPGPGFQVVPVPTRAQWDDPTLGNYYLWEAFANKVPQWGDVYFPTLKKITDGYRLFVTNLAVPPSSSADSSTIDKTRRAYLDDTRKLNQLLAAASNWQNGQLKKKKAKQAQKLRARIQSDAARYSALLGEAHRAFLGAGDLLTEFENPAYQRETRSPDGLTLAYRTFNISPDLTAWVAESKPRPSAPLATVVVPRPVPSRIPGQVKPVDAMTTDPMTGRTVPDPRSELHFWVFGGSNQIMELNQNVSGLDVKGKRVTMFTITPGKWFNGAALQFFRNGPWLDGPVKQGLVSFWGDKGQLNLMPAALIVLYEPTVVLRSRDAQPSALASQIQSVIKTSKQLTFGSLTFLDTLSRVETAESSVTITDLSGRAYVIAVINAVLPDGSSSRASLSGMPGGLWTFNRRPLR